MNPKRTSQTHAPIHTTTKRWRCVEYRHDDRNGQYHALAVRWRGVRFDVSLEVDR